MLVSFVKGRFLAYVSATKGYLTLVVSEKNCSPGPEFRTQWNHSAQVV